MESALDLDDLFLDALGALVPAALDQIGDDEEARFRLIRRQLAVAGEVAVQAAVAARSIQRP